MRSAKTVPFGWIAGTVAVNEAGAEGIGSLTGSLVGVAAGTAATPSEDISFLRSAPSLTANKVGHLCLFVVSFLWQKQGANHKQGAAFGCEGPPPLLIFRLLSPPNLIASAGRYF